MPGTIDLFEAMRAHWAWRVRLRLAVEGLGDAMDAGEAADPAACALGRWLHEGGRAYLGRPAFAELVAAHQVFHQAGGTVARHLAAGDEAGARALLEPEGALDRASSDLVLALLKLLRDTEAG